MDDSDLSSYSKEEYKEIKLFQLLTNNLIVIIGILGSTASIYPLLKGMDKKYALISLLLTFTLILTSCIINLYINYKKLHHDNNNLLKYNKKIEVNRNALINELETAQVESKKYKDLYWAAKSFFIQSTNTKTDEERSRLLNLYIQLNERNDINE